MDPNIQLNPKKSYSQKVDGFQIPGMFSAEAYRSAVRYKPRPDDLFLVTYPKCGTTWTQHMISLIFRNGEPVKSMFVHFASSPFLEMTGAKAAEEMPRPNAIKVHLPFHLTPWSEKTKYIYVTRNPKDTCVSYFHHMSNLAGHVFHGTFDDFFEMFISGDIDYGDYFDHLLGWYAHRDDPNVLFMTYEEMKEDPATAILKMASFIDDEKYAEPLRSDPERLKKILLYSSFDHMKTTVNRDMDDMMKMSKEDIEKSTELSGHLKELLYKMTEAVEKMKDVPKPSATNFVRKGIIGDWRNHFSEEQSRRLDEKFAEKMKDTIFPELWNKYM